MKLNKIIIEGVFAHFKIPGYSKYQRTYEIPPISTVVGILKNIYGEEISDFILGYTINYKKKGMDATKIYKELDMSERSFNDSKRFTTDLCYIEYLYDVELLIYTNISDQVILREPLLLGKTNCLASIRSIEEVNLIQKNGYGYNQYTTKDIGTGQIRRINTLTKYNNYTDMYDFQTCTVRDNKEFEYDKHYDETIMQNIYLWKWKDGEIHGVI